MSGIIGVVAADELHNFFDLFSEGSEVEVTIDEDGLRDCWFVATLIDPPYNPRILKRNPLERYVEYRDLLVQNRSQPLREYISVPFIRPSPLLGYTKSFELNDIVDAFYKDGWWTGVITKIFDKFKFQVTCQNLPYVIYAEVKDLRFHMDWINGEWFKPKKQVIGLLDMPNMYRVSVYI